jgi:hypothetical protein
MASIDNLRYLMDHLQEKKNPYEENKDLIVFAIYLDIGSMAKDRAQIELIKIKEAFEPIIEKMRGETGKSIHCFYFPRNGESKMECIYPPNLSREKDEISELLEESDDKFFEGDNDIFEKLPNIDLKTSEFMERIKERLKDKSRKYHG